MTRPDPYEAAWLLGFLRNDAGQYDARGLDIAARAADLGCEPTLDAVVAALEAAACVDCGTRPCDYHHTLRLEDAARVAERRAS
jgi:hypothetical protein